AVLRVWWERSGLGMTVARRRSGTGRPETRSAARSATSWLPRPLSVIHRAPRRSGRGFPHVLGGSMATPLSAARFLAALKAEGLTVVEVGNWRTHNRN